MMASTVYTDRILQDDSVEDEADESAGRGRGGADNADNVQHLHDEFAELAVFNELAQVQQRRLLRVCNRVHQVHNGVHDAGLEECSRVSINYVGSG